ncbi:hypothetical protein C8R44DRAFT_895836 [Mycena epipterygia]|nr:hypothetical protein C8R44DRAFT_895836 [Mycena epipterygia]
MALGPGAKESYAGVFIENILYGFYLSVFIECCVLLWRKQQTRNAKQMYVMATTIVMFILITMRCILDTTPCILAFHSDGLEFGPPNSPMGIVTNACWFLVTAVADAFIIFRTFIVWKKNWFVIILPSLLFLATCGCSIWGLHSLVIFNPATSSVFSIVMPINVFIYLTLSTNVLCTGLISYRIFTIRRNVAGVLSSGAGRSDGVTTKIISIIVESASIYTLLLIAQLIANNLGSYVTYILVDCTPATIGLVFSYIIIRVSRGSSYGDTTGQVDTSRSRDRGNNFELSQTRNGRSGTRSEVQIKLERVTVQHSDLDSAKEVELNSKKCSQGSVV